MHKIASNSQPTSFDVLKSVAIITLLIDHFGFFFVNNVELFRVIGRMGYLLFIFCYGYNRNYQFDARVLSLTFLMLLNHSIMYPGDFHLIQLSQYSILVSVIVAQIFMYFFVRKINEGNVFVWLALLELLALPTRTIFQFGTEGIIICICGYICATYGKSSKTHPILLAIGLLFYAIIESIDHGFNYFSLAILTIIFIAIWYILARFENKPVKIPGGIISFLSKYSLLIFYVHYEIFAIIHWAWPKLEL